MLLGGQLLSNLVILRLFLRSPLPAHRLYGTYMLRLGINRGRIRMEALHVYEHRPHDSARAE